MSITQWWPTVFLHSQLYCLLSHRYFASNKSHLDHGGVLFPLPLPWPTPPDDEVERTKSDDNHLCSSFKEGLPTSWSLKDKFIPLYYVLCVGCQCPIYRSIVDVDTFRSPKSTPTWQCTTHFLEILRWSQKTTNMVGISQPAMFDDIESNLSVTLQFPHMRFIECFRSPHDSCILMLYPSSSKDPF